MGKGKRNRNHKSGQKRRNANRSPRDEPTGAAHEPDTASGGITLEEFFKPVKHWTTRVLGAFSTPGEPDVDQLGEVVTDLVDADGHHVIATWVYWARWLACAYGTGDTLRHELPTGPPHIDDHAHRLITAVRSELDPGIPVAIDIGDGITGQDLWHLTVMLATPLSRVMAAIGGYTELRQILKMLLTLTDGAEERAAEIMHPIEPTAVALLLISYGHRDWATTVLERATTDEVTGQGLLPLLIVTGSRLLRGGTTQAVIDEHGLPLEIGHTIPDPDTGDTRASDLLRTATDAMTALRDTDLPRAGKLLNTIASHPPADRLLLTMHLAISIGHNLAARRTSARTPSPG